MSGMRGWLVSLVLLERELMLRWICFGLCNYSARPELAARGEVV